jgi:hypothetical protein
MSVHATVVACLFTLALAPLSAAAQPAQVEGRAARLGDRTARVVTRWEADGSGSGRLLIEGSPPTSLYRGGGGAATITVGHDAWLVAYEVDARRNPFRARLIRRQNGRVNVGDEVSFARPGNRHDLPFAVVATARPDGFSVFFQEVQEDDPSAAHTYLARLDSAGQPVGTASEVQVPWTLADAIWNGNGYHLALIYPGSQTGMRLSMVSTTAEGSPQQHPDWASAAGMVSDVHLAKSGNRILAFYRGGGGGRIFEGDVTQVRSWGSEPPAAQRRGAIDGRELIALRRDGESVRPVAVRAQR